MICYKSSYFFIIILKYVCNAQINLVYDYDDNNNNVIIHALEITKD